MLIGHGVGKNKTPLVSYDSGTDEVVILETDKYRQMAWQLYHQFFPNTILQPKIEQSRFFNPQEFSRLCGFSPKVRECNGLSKH